MAYMDRGSTGTRDGHGWAIAGAFVGQAAIIVGLGAVLVTTGTSGAATQASAGPAPTIAAPESAASLAPAVQPLVDFPYQVAMEGQQGGGAFPDALSVPAFTVKPGQDLTVALDVTVPSAQRVISVSVSLIGPHQGAGAPDFRASYNDSVQAQAPGTRSFLLTWPVSGGELRPGTQWALSMTAGVPNGSVAGTIARITVAP